MDTTKEPQAKEKNSKAPLPENSGPIRSSVKIINERKPKKKQPPPIIVDGVVNFNTFHEKITAAITGCQFKIMNNKTTKINASDSASYRQLVSILKETK